MSYTRGLSEMPISFPGLGLEFCPDPVALPIGNGIYWYGILIAAGILLATWFCSRQAPKYGLTADHIYDVVLCGVPAAIVGARAYYVLFYQELYRTAEGKLDWGEIVAVWDGGLAVYGGLLAALLAGAIYCRIKSLCFWAVTDVAVMGFFIGQAVGRWGNFVNREAFGAATELPWRMGLWVTQQDYIEVHPTFLYESLWNTVGLLLLYFAVSRARRFDGENTCFYFLWYGLGRSWIEGLRTDSLYLFDWTLFGEPIRVSQALSGLMALGACAVLLVQLRRQRKNPTPLYVERQRAQ